MASVVGARGRRDQGGSTWAAYTRGERAVGGGEGNWQQRRLEPIPGQLTEPKNDQLNPRTPVTPENKPTHRAWRQTIPSTIPAAMGGHHSHNKWARKTMLKVSFWCA